MYIYLNLYYYIHVAYVISYDSNAINKYNRRKKIITINLSLRNVRNYFYHSFTLNVIKIINIYFYIQFIRTYNADKVL